MLIMYAYKNLSICYPNSHPCLKRYMALREEDERHIWIKPRGDARGPSFAHMRNSRKASGKSCIDRAYSTFWMKWAKKSALLLQDEFSRTFSFYVFPKKATGTSSEVCRTECTDPSNHFSFGSPWRDEIRIPKDEIW